MDTAYAIALSSRKDNFHKRAVSLAGRMRATGTRLLTTRAILLEIGNSLAKERYRRAAVNLLRTLETDPTVKIMPVSEEPGRVGTGIHDFRVIPKPSRRVPTRNKTTIPASSAWAHAVNVSRQNKNHGRHVPTLPGCNSMSTRTRAFIKSCDKILKQLEQIVRPKELYHNILWC